MITYEPPRIETRDPVTGPLITGKTVTVVCGVTWRSADDADHAGPADAEPGQHD